MNGGRRTLPILGSPAVVFGLALYGLARSLLRLSIADALSLAAVGAAVSGAALVWHQRRLHSRVAAALQSAGLTGASARPGAGGRVRLTLPAGFGLRDVASRVDALEHALASSVQVRYDHGQIELQVHQRRVPERAALKDLGSPPHSAVFPLPIGMAAGGPTFLDLASAHHLLIGGHTGAGKSVFLRQALTSLVERCSPQELGLALIDLKGGVELAIFRDLPHLLAPIAPGFDAAADLLAQLEAELAARQERLQRHVADGEETGAADLRRGRRILVVVDELAELSPAEATDAEERARRQAALASLSRLARLGRGFGFHLVVSTQRPDADVLPGQIKANLPATLAFRVRSELNSRILLGDGQPQAASLPPAPGRALLQFDDLVEVQVPYISRAATRLAVLHAAFGSTHQPAPSALLERSRLRFLSSADQRRVEPTWHGSRPEPCDTGPRNCTDDPR